MLRVGPIISISSAVCPGIMPGIFGLSISNHSGLTSATWRGALKSFFLRSQGGGNEASGIAIVTSDRILIHKDSVPPEKLLVTSQYERTLSEGENSFFQRSADAKPESLLTIGHVRLVADSLQGIDANNQPFSNDDIVVVHSGTVVNADDLWAKLAREGVVARANVDTEVIAALIQKEINNGLSLTQALSTVFDRVQGGSSVAILDRRQNLLVLGTNTGSIHVCLPAKNKGLLFASERTTVEYLVTGSEAIVGFENSSILQLKAGQGGAFDLETQEFVQFDLSHQLATPQISVTLAAQRRLEDKAERFRSALKGIRRCSKCLVPETMPFVSYDADGVCSYCNQYVPVKRKPIESLNEMLDNVRSKDGTPDCIVAFSGGRDSSYGLHLLKTKYRMTPIAYSYDWGMVTDLARRNQARLCGKLGIEHIWLSADIRKKRQNIRRNVSAWLRQPDIGMIPLFMAGDKQFLWFANKLMKQTKIAQMVFCANEHEKTDFKTGFLNINNGSANIGKPSSAKMGTKAELLLSYGSRVVRNPAYINRSIPDTLWAYVSYYIIKQDYLQLFEYEPWLEHEVEGALKDEYQWELDDDTPSSWRIGDGTAAFYNYIYHMVCGFTEFDTFRSSQIRAGYLTRERAAELVEQENMPRWQSLREYFDLINLDFVDAIQRVDRIPKLYASYA